uniref:2-oxo-4-hydroxy-4-carboxy-5-ureidoimidazoline decarboxylase n=1 Tax=Lygus hesperus TaxID=30085 RepID=A0A0A9Y1R8_LYGHE
MDVAQLNQLDCDEFTKLFSNVFEHHSEAAEYVYSQRPFRDQAHVIESFCRYMDQLPLGVKRQILVNHPMLGSKSSMTQESTKEQKSAGLRNLRDSEADVLYEFNRKYYDKFGFPYIICVLETNKDEILSDIQKRYNNDVDTETLRGIDEVKKIAKHRIFGLVA